MLLGAPSLSCCVTRRPPLRVSRSPLRPPGLHWQGRKESYGASNRSPVSPGLTFTLQALRSVINITDGKRADKTPHLHAFLPMSTCYEVVLEETYFSPCIGQWNLPHWWQQGAKSIWKSCSQYFLPSNWNRKYQRLVNRKQSRDEWNFSAETVGKRFLD